jgi:uncharacterized protein (TIGR03435 family)
MLQRLLEERFALKVRTEISTVDMLALVVGRSDGTLGPKVKPWDGTCQSGAPSEEDDPARPRCPSGYRAGGIFLDGATMFSVAEVLSLPQSRSLLGTIVDDQTGLNGRYTMELDYPFAPQRPADTAAPAGFAPPSLFTAVQEQWGLRVCRARGRSDSSWSRARRCLPQIDTKASTTRRRPRADVTHNGRPAVCHAVIPPAISCTLPIPLRARRLDAIDER